MAIFGITSRGLMFSLQWRGLYVFVCFLAFVKEIFETTTTTMRFTLFEYLNNVGRGVQIMMLLIMQFSPASSPSSQIGPYIPLEHPQSCNVSDNILYKYKTQGKKARNYAF